MTPTLPPLSGRARLGLRFFEAGEWTETIDTGWAVIDGQWVHWLDDEFDRWQSWPVGHVTFVEWEDK